MKIDKLFPCDIHLTLSEDMFQELKAEGKRRDDMPVNALLREIIRDYLSKEHASSGIDTTTEIIRKVIREELKPFENRMAKLSAKAAVAAATSMYLNVQTIADLGKIDAIETYEKARIKAVNYIRTPGEDND